MDPSRGKQAAGASNSTAKGRSPTGRPSMTAINSSPHPCVTAVRFGFRAAAPDQRSMTTSRPPRGHAIRMAFHLGPAVDARPMGAAPELTWFNGEHHQERHPVVTARPVVVRGDERRDRTHPRLVSRRGFGEKQPAWALIGDGVCGQTGCTTYSTVLQFHS